MQNFIDGKIDETGLYKLSFKLKPHQIEGIYISMMVLDKAYRRKGIMLRAVKKQLTPYIKKYKHLGLFTWPYSNAGRGCSERIAKDLHMKLYIKGH